jgi:hypothetical protein
MIKNMDNYSTWDNLKKINSSKIINSMYIWIFIVPIVVKLFESVNKNLGQDNLRGSFLKISNNILKNKDKG